MYPLGSCTMKYNPRLNEQVAAMPGFADAAPRAGRRGHPGPARGAAACSRSASARSPASPACSLMPAAGAHGEFLGMLVIRAWHQSRGEPERVEILIPDSAHGTNPAIGGDRRA